MKYFKQPSGFQRIAPGEYEFSIVASNVIPYLEQLQIVYRFNKKDDESFRAYHLESYPIDLSETSDFSLLMNYSFCSVYSDFIIEIDTDDLGMTCGYCNVILDIYGEAKIDIKSMDFTATLCGEVDMSEEDRNLYCNK